MAISWESKVDTNGVLLARGKFVGDDISMYLCKTTTSTFSFTTDSYTSFETPSGQDKVAGKKNSSNTDICHTFSVN